MFLKKRLFSVFFSFCEENGSPHEGAVEKIGHILTEKSRFFTFFSVRRITMNKCLKSGEKNLNTFAKMQDFPLSFSGKSLTIRGFCATL